MIFNLLFDPGSHALTAWELQHWVTNKAGDCSFKNYKVVLKLSILFFQITKRNGFVVVCWCAY